MKTTVSQISSSIIVPNRTADQAGTAVTDQPKTGSTPRAHIIDRRAARWARRSAH